MKITLQQTEELLSGDYPFTQRGFSMMITRLKSRYADDPSQSNLQKCMDEINFFIDKYMPVMGNDFIMITKI